MTTKENVEVAVESAHSFGDGLFNASLIKAISEKHKSKVTVAVRPHCADAFDNLPFVDKVVIIQEMGEGTQLLANLGYKNVYQITQNIKFMQFKSFDKNHSLVNTPLMTGMQLGIGYFDQRPIFIPSEKELKAPLKIEHDKPIIAIESVYTSSQSWAKKKHFDTIVEKFQDTHKILWLSNEGCPKNKNIDDMLRFTRRECICCLSLCEYFFSVGSGFFCASLALPKSQQPKNTICLWEDNLYKYKDVLNEKQWNPNITWVEDEQEFLNTITNIRN